MIQVIAMHRLSKETERFLQKLDNEVNIIYAPLHVARFCDAPQATQDWMIHLIQGKDVQAGGCRTIFLPSGSSVVSCIIVALWAGLTGDMPEILNLIKRGESLYIPSPEMPLISLGGLKAKMRGEFRMGVGQREVVIKKLRSVDHVAQE